MYNDSGKTFICLSLLLSKVVSRTMVVKRHLALMTCPHHFIFFFLMLSMRSFICLSLLLSKVVSRSMVVERRLALMTCPHHFKFLYLTLNIMSSNQPILYNGALRSVIYNMIDIRNASAGSISSHF